MQGEILAFRDFLYCIDTEEYNFYEYEEWQLEIEDKKLSLLDLPIAYREYCDVRSRGAAKTWIEMAQALYLSSLRVDTWYGFGRLRGYWYSTSEDQLDQPREYFDYILDHSFLRYCIHRRKAMRVIFHNYGKLKLTILTAKKARSGRADYAKFDELAGLRLLKEKELYDAAVGVLSGTWFGFKGHISTPCKATKFEEKHDDCKRLELQTGYQHTFKVPWWEAGFLAKNKEFYEQEEKTKPRWWYLQEYCAEFTLPMGAVFQNVVYDVYELVDNEWRIKLPLILDNRTVSGVDWNPISGHWCVGGQWLENGLGFVVTHAVPIAVGYSHKLKEEAYIKIKEYAIHRKRLCMESGGINEEYVDWFKEWFGKDKNKRDVYVLYEEWDSGNINKTNAVLSMLDKTIYVDRIRFPELAKQIEDCQWDSDATVVRINKDPADSPHALDAFLHGINKRLLKDVSMRRFDWYGST